MPLSNAFQNHDHRRCTARALARVQGDCTKRKLRLTPVRARVLEYLLESHRALGAYDVLDRLKADKIGSKPPQAYRALEFLVSHGYAHRIERLNAYVACCQSAQNHSPAFLICRGCHRVAEVTHNSLEDAIGRSSRELDFSVECMVSEAEGLCASCRKSIR